MDITEFNLQARIEDIHWWFRARREIILDLLKKYMPMGLNKMLAEIGCGTGGNLKFLRNHYQVIGVDISPDAVRYARERTGCNVLLGDFRNVLIYKWENIDIVLLADVLEHVEEDARFLKDIVEAMKTGAILLITVPAHSFLWSQHDKVLGHKRRYSGKALRSLWENLKVEELFFSSFNSILLPLIAVYRVFKVDTLRPAKSDLRLPLSWINHLLYRVFSIERIFLRFFPLPCGISYIAVLRKIK